MAFLNPPRACTQVLEGLRIVICFSNKALGELFNDATREGNRCSRHGSPGPAGLPEGQMEAQEVKL
jgi:hypothetical protein